MNKKLKITGLALAGAAVIGWLGVQHTSAEQEDPTFERSDVEQIVIDQYGGTITELELEKKKGKAVYEIEVHDGKKEFELLVDAETGEVIKEKIDDRDDVEKKHPDKKPAIKEKQVENKKPQNKDNVSRNAKAEENLIGMEEAKTIALREFDGRIEELELDEDDGRLVYEIELGDGNREAELEIDAKTGEIVELDMEHDD